MSANMDLIKLWKLGVCFTITLQCLASSMAQVVGECSARCWNPVQINYGIDGATRQEGVASEEDCKALCLNTEKCIGIDWDNSDNGCWLQLTTLNLFDMSNVNHWSLANCTDDCVSYCWRPVEIDVHVSGGICQSNITDENHCKQLCSNTPSCTGINWKSHCHLLNRTETVTDDQGAHHWAIERNLPTICQATSTHYSTYASTVPTVKDNTSPTVIITSNTVEPLQSSTKSSEEKLTELSENLIAGIVVLAVFLGLGIVIIIGLVINTIRIGRKLHQKSDIKNIELDVNYERLRRADTNVSSEDGIYMNIVKTP